MSEEKITRGRCFGQGQYDWNDIEQLRAEIVRLSGIEAAAQGEMSAIRRHLEKLENAGGRER